MSVALEYISPGNWEIVQRNAEITAKHLRPPMPNARVYNNANISIPNATLTALTFNSERWDVGELHSTSVNTGRLTAPITGLYKIGGHVRWAVNSTNQRSLRIRLNGGADIAIESGMGLTDGNESFTNVVTAYRLAKNEYVDLAVYQNSGAALLIQSAGNYSPEFWMYRVGGYENEGVA